MKFIRRFFRFGSTAKSSSPTAPTSIAAPTTPPPATSFQTQQMPLAPIYVSNIDATTKQIKDTAEIALNARGKTIHNLQPAYETASRLKAGLEHSLTKTQGLPIPASQKEQQARSAEILNLRNAIQAVEKLISDIKESAIKESFPLKEVVLSIPKAPTAENEQKALDKKAVTALKQTGLFTSAEIEAERVKRQSARKPIPPSEPTPLPPELPPPSYEEAIKAGATPPIQANKPVQQELPLSAPSPTYPDISAQAQALVPTQAKLPERGVTEEAWTKEPSALKRKTEDMEKRINEAYRESRYELKNVEGLQSAYDEALAMKATADKFPGIPKLRTEAKRLKEWAENKAKAIDYEFKTPERAQTLDGQQDKGAESHHFRDLAKNPPSGGHTP